MKEEDEDEEGANEEEATRRKVYQKGPCGKDNDENEENDEDEEDDGKEEEDSKAPSSSSRSGEAWMSVSKRLARHLKRATQTNTQIDRHT